MQNQTTTREFSFVSGPIGAGKTELIINAARESNSKSEHVLIVQPGVMLCKKTAIRGNELKKLPVGRRHRFVDLTSSTTDSVTKTIIETITSAPRYDGITITCTAAALRLMNESERAALNGKISIHRDEEEEVLKTQRYNISDSYRQFFQFFSLTEYQKNGVNQPDFRKLVANRSYLTSEHDSITGQLAILKKYVKNPHVDVIVNWKHLHAQLENSKSPILRELYESGVVTEKTEADETVETDESLIIYVTVFELPSLYDIGTKTTFYGANFDRSMQRNLWEDYGVQWTEVETNLPKSIPCSNTFIIPYFKDPDLNWSKTTMYRQYGDTTYLQAFIDATAKRLKGHPYIYLRNNQDDTRSAVDWSPVAHSGTGLPAMSHGLNDYRNYDTFVSFGAFLESNESEPFYRLFGSSTRDTRQTRHAQVVYQAAGRGCIRNHQDDPYFIYVPTVKCGQEQLREFPGATLLDPFKNFDGFGDIKKSPRFQLRPDWSPIPEKDESTPPTEWTLTWSDKKTYASESEAGFERINTTEFPKISKIDHPIAHFIEGRYGLSMAGLDAAGVQAAKAEQHMFSSALFHQHASGVKARFLIGHAPFIALDFDKTILTSAQLDRIFTGVQYIRYGTVSDSPRNKYRSFRVVLPLDRCMTTAEYRRIAAYLFDKIQNVEKRAGLAEKGIDRALKNPVQRYYVPHIESTIEVTWKQRKIATVDKLLMEAPPESAVLTPQLDGDLISVGTPEEVAAANQTRKESGDSRIVAAVEDIFRSIRNGNRTDACKDIALQIRRIHSRTLFENLRSRLEHEINQMRDGKQTHLLNIADGTRSPTPRTIRRHERNA